MAKKKELVESLVETELVEGVEEKAPVPFHGSPGFADYVLSKLEPTELVDGNPTTAGLRRIFPSIFGPPIFSGPITIFPAEPDTGNRATVLYEIQYLNPRSETEYDKVIRVVDGADSAKENTENGYHIFPTAIAITRAEGRCLRKALGISKVVAEEVVKITQESLQRPDEISAAQVKAIGNLSQEANVNVKKFLSLSNVTSTRELNVERARKAISLLSDYAEGRKAAPSHIVGFDPNWRDYD